MPIIINDVEISDDAIFTEMQYHSAESQEEARDKAGQALVVRELLRQQATRSGKKLDGVDEEDVDNALMGLIESEINVPEATSEVCERYYEQNKARFRAQDATDITLPFSQVEERIRDYLHTRSVREGIRSYVLELAGCSRISGFDLAASL